MRIYHKIEMLFLGSDYEVESIRKKLDSIVGVKDIKIKKQENIELK